MRTCLQDAGDFYRLLPEGVYDGWDGSGDPIGSKQGMGLDANRQYPRGYIPEGGQPGAGNTPMHLKEVEAHIKAVTARNNICISLSYHTTVCNHHQSFWLLFAVFLGCLTEPTVTLTRRVERSYMSVKCLIAQAMMRKKCCRWSTVVVMSPGTRSGRRLVVVVVVTH
eukprot:SAG31_NODE_214_length_20084_cov_2.644684_7_plen_167_part_00